MMPIEEFKTLNLEEMRAEIDSWPLPPMTAEELRLSTPYSDLEGWVYILAGERMSGRSRYQGPPGLLTQVENLLSSTTAPEMISMLLERTIPIEKIKAGLGAAST